LTPLTGTAGFSTANAGAAFPLGGKNTLWKPRNLYAIESPTWTLIRAG
jgi:hypothetical protein